MNTDLLPLYTAEQSRQLDALCIADENISGFQLMQRAGEAAFRLMMRRWPGLNTVTIVCGIGNNGGDGYVIAKLAAQQGLAVEVIQLGDASRQSGDARLALQSMQAIGLQATSFQYQQSFNGEVLVDAIFGTGLVREVEGIWKTAIEAINAASSPVLAIDIPSGVNADTGAILGCAIQADATVTFIARKRGLYTADARQLCGDIYFESLGVCESVYNKVIPSAYRVTHLSGMLSEKRPVNSHKKMFGHVLVIGGAPGMRGAAQLSAHAALRSGAGLVSVATHPNHADYFNLTLPELMVHGVNEDRQLLQLMDNADVIVVGPGLGQSSWAQAVLDCAISGEQPLVMDADALNLLAAQKKQSDHWILTPHPGEAAKLLHTTTQRIQSDRFNAAAQISQIYGGVCVLKGAGTIIHDAEQSFVCPLGNPGMASAGMGDVLTGMMGAVLAQCRQHSAALREAALFAVVLHAKAGDMVAKKSGQKGMLASDLLFYSRQMINDNE